MAKPNYEFAKRQRDLAKKQKKEEKLRRKAEANAPAVPADGTTAGQTDADGSQGPTTEGKV